MPHFLNPIIVILLNEEDKKYYPAIASESYSGLPKSDKFSHLFRGKISTYLKVGYDTMADAKQEIINNLCEDTQIEQTCVDTVVSWNGKGHPSMQVHIEKVDGIFKMVS